MNRPKPMLHTTGPLPFMLTAPAGGQRGLGQRPLLCFLHGYDEGQPTPIEQALTRHGPFRSSSAQLALQEFIVLAPQLPISGDLWYQHAAAVRTIVQQVQAAHRADRARTFLSGFSFGGNGVLDLAQLQPDLWRALWPVDPTRVPKGSVSQDIWLSSGQLSRRSSERFVRQLDLSFFEPQAVDEALDHNRVYLDEGQNHVGTATAAYQDETIYRWLLAR